VSLDFAQILREHWGPFVQAAAGPIPARAWAAVEAVLTCRTPRRGGHLHHCTPCQRSVFLYHSCNHRACPRCGGRDAALWSRRQEARLLPVPYYLLTITVPAELRPAFHLFPAELYPALFAAKASALKTLCASPKYLGGQPAFISVLHTWTRRMFFLRFASVASRPHFRLAQHAMALARGCSSPYPLPHSRCGTW
jgi:hypothetical protein